MSRSRGITSSRQIEQLCRENIMFMALSCDSQPHFTTIAGFVSKLHGEIETIFADVLVLCGSMGLIGRQMFAIDGCKISSNASKEWNGTRKKFEKKKTKMEREIRRFLKKHRDEDDQGGPSPDQRERENQPTPCQFAWFQTHLLEDQKYTRRMQRKIDSDEGKHEYSKRLGIIEPVFANITKTLGLNRFSLRGKKKVSAQWKLFCLVYNIGKIQRYGMAT